MRPSSTKLYSPPASGGEEAQPVRVATSVLKAREALARLGAVNQEANTDTAEKDFVAARWPDHLHASASASILIPFLGQRRHPPQERISRTATDQAL
jgi:hypothetical protein